MMSRLANVLYLRSVRRETSGLQGPVDSRVTGCFPQATSTPTRDGAQRTDASEDLRRQR